MNKEAVHAVTEEASGRCDARTARVKVVPPPLPPEYQTGHDPIVHTCAPPIAETKVEPKAAPSSSADKFPSGSLDQLQIVPRRRGKQESTGWLSSIVLHAALIAIIGLILAPADYGGANAMKLIISFSDQEADDEIEVQPLLEVAVSENEITPQPAIDALPLIDPLPIAAAGSPKGKSVEISSGNATRGNASPRGLFFGIEAYGHEFVYVLDMSGSMEGRRFNRASAELERSISELQESQNFYVLLFDDTAVQMFNGSGIRPKSVPATSENKAKLSKWLSTAYRGGGTDPRDALRIALRMDPSAIFMLSDGKFNGKKNQRSSLVRGNSDAFSIVAAASTGIPIHAIAFENASSCKNMKRLAEMTDGAYRFCRAADDDAAKAALTRALALRNLGNVGSATKLMREVVFNFEDTESAWTARRELSAMLADVAGDALESRQLDVAKAAFLEIVSLDALAVMNGDIQQELLQKLIERSNQESDVDAKKAFSILDDVVQRYPKSRVTQQIIGPIADRLMDEAMQLGANGDPVRSIKKMEEVLTKYPQTPAAARCQIEQKQVTEGLLARAAKLRHTADDAASANFLNELLAELKGTGVEAVVTKATQQLATELLTKARDATVNRDPVTKNDAERQLSEGFGGEQILQRMQRDFARKERVARDLLRRAIRLENIAEFDGAGEIYNRILSDYASTLVAKKAQDRLRAIQRKQKEDSPVEEVDLELLKMMSS